jgi:hemoglobin
VDEAHHKVAPAGFKYLVTAMLWWASGGPQRYSGRSMEDSHRHRAITLVEWQAFTDDVRATLDKFSVPPAEQADVKALVESTRTAIVGSDKVEPSAMTSSSSLAQDSAAIAS